MTTPRWTALTLNETVTPLGVKIVVTTDVPCHLWCRITTTPPLTHFHPITVRGVTRMADPYFCFDNYHDNEQEEPGDTLTHTFIKQPWPYCETRYFYFHGSIAAVPSPSTSPIFKYHRIQPLLPPTQEYEYGIPFNWVTLFRAASNYGTGNIGVGPGSDFVALSDHPINRIKATFRQNFSRYPPCGLDIRLYKAQDNGNPIPPFLTQAFIPASTIPPYPTPVTIDLDLPLVNVTIGQRYTWLFFAIEEGLPSRQTCVQRGNAVNYTFTPVCNLYGKADLKIEGGGSPVTLYWENWIIS